MNDYYLSLVNRGTALTAKEKRYVEKTLLELQTKVTQRQAIGLLASVPSRFDYASESVSLG
jgi:hypothetical protein